MRSFITAAAFIFVTACEQESTGTPVGVSTPTAGSVQKSDCLGEDTGGDTSSTGGDLIVDPAGAGTVHVEDVADLACCIEGVKANTAADGGTLTITYEAIGEQCDCMCTYAVSFDVSGLASGDWTVNAQSDSATVTVE